MISKKLYEDIIGAVLGCFGGGVFITNVPVWLDKIFTFLLFFLSAFTAAFIGVFAKRCGEWALKKLFK